MICILTNISIQQLHNWVHIPDAYGSSQPVFDAQVYSIPLLTIDVDADCSLIYN